MNQMTENDFILFDRIEVIRKTIEKYGEENSIFRSVVARIPLHYII